MLKKVCIAGKTGSILCFLNLLAIAMSGCYGQSHFATMSDIQQAAQTGDYQRAAELIEQKKELNKSKNEVLYLLELGILNHLNQEYTRSNQLLTRADKRMEELDAISISGTAAAWILSEKTQSYRGEDFERVLVHYYMALNYLMLGDLQEALVECRRVNTLLQEFNDRYEQKNVYKTDAFMLYLSGLIYDAMGEVNDAFIDYRQAYQTYISDYREFYETPVPSQLPGQLLRTSSALGFQDVFEEYQKEFPSTTWSTQQAYRQAARLVVIWDNGIIPYKVERVFRWYYGLFDSKASGCYVKFAFPDFIPRIQIFSNATVSVGGHTQPLELAEDLGKIAIKNLENRRIRTITQAVVRNLVKCIIHQQIEEDWVVSLIFAGFVEFSEGVDVRHWFLLPSDVRITQLLLQPGVQDIELAFLGAQGEPLYHARYENITLEQGETTFLIHRTF